MQYLQKEKNLSIDEIAQYMDVSIDHIKKVLKSEETLTPNNIITYLKATNQHFWEFAIAAIPIGHLPEKAKNRVLLCKEISDHLKKNSKK